ncbi:hypothetical protein [Microbacterium sp. RU33B]|uniref:hypothetical protein n=1 Tax=Microbacterium sp. RU33B TaxID=1907390 RepID=UPI000969ABF6|nr:hypothetical protein [Microbacterium sp. RU33B]SIT83681.1 hypothetical protein SAMN05880545_2082 [Microbacterium sp. RU33B]
MDEITFGQLLLANGMLVTIVSAALVVLAVALLVRRRRRFRRMPTTIDGVRIEPQGAVVDEDLVIEQNWRITLLMHNVTRKPAAVPALRPRAVVAAGHNQYAATVYLEREVRELNPGDALVVWVLVRLSGDEEPRFVELEHTPTGVGGRVVTLRSRSIASLATPPNRHVAPRASGRGH